MTTESIVEISSPYFEDLTVGQVFDDAPAVTITAGHAAIHTAVFGERLRLPLDAELSRAVTGRSEALVSPNLVCNAAIGQTTFASGRVLGNLFYRGLVLEGPVFIGDTLRTTTTIAAMRQNRPKPGRPASGMAVFKMHVENQHGQTVLDFWRCPMLPCRDPEADTGHSDAFDAIADQLDMARVMASVPSEWKLGVLRENLPGRHFADIETGSHYRVVGRDTVTSAPEIARMTLNVAATHTDAAASAYGKRLVYGGHTISIALAQISRALPNLVTVIAWRSCDHTSPVFEDDILATEFTVEATHALPGGGGLIDLRALVYADRGPGAPEPGERVAVLDWRLLALMA